MEPFECSSELLAVTAPSSASTGWEKISEAQAKRCNNVDCGAAAGAIDQHATVATGVNADSVGAVGNGTFCRVVFTTRTHINQLRQDVFNQIGVIGGRALHLSTTFNQREGVNVIGS